jgi:hypothetical protein
MRFDKTYFGLSVLTFLIEVVIALFVKDSFVRPYVGDVLVVMLMYCFIRSFFNLNSIRTALFVLIFSFIIEFLQYMNIIEMLGLRKSALARTVLGTTFVWYDLVAYTIGVLIILIIENQRHAGIQTCIRQQARKVKSTEL